MDITRVEITDMPGPGLVELMLQSGGLLIQIAAAAATFAAVILALRIARRDSELRRDQQRRESALVWMVVRGQMASAVTGATTLIAEIDALLDPNSAALPVQERMRRLEASSGRFNFEPTWRLVEKIGWLPHDVSLEVGRVLTLAPVYMEGLRLIFDWKGPVADLPRQAKAIRDVGDQIAKACQKVLNLPQSLIAE